MPAVLQQTKNQTQLFRIHLKPDVKPQEAFKVHNGRVEENSIVTGNEVKVLLDPPECNIPNFYSHHVVKIKSEKTDKYEGKFRFVDDFANETGTVESIEIRYVSNCPSLDKQWQIANGYKPKDYMEEFGWAFPSNYIQDYDLSKTDPLFIEFIYN